MIFWTVLASFATAKIYDSRQKKAVQNKWCDLVAHISQQKLDTQQLPRKLTIFLAAMPGDGIGPSRQYFKDYVKPVLVAASMDYEVIEGRKEGDVRYGTAEQIRRLRRKKGERGPSQAEPEMDGAMLVDQIRDQRFIHPEPGVRGDLVLGRHTWKEYIRGLHEGWLGPIDEPADPVPEITSPSSLSLDDDKLEVTDDESPQVPEEKPEETKKEEEKKKKISPPPAYLATSAYSTSPLSPHIPSILEPSEPIHQQHLLGFLKTPQRIWNFLNKRKLADDVGRQTAAIVLAQYRPYIHQESFASSSTDSDLEAVPIATRAQENDAVETVQTAEAFEQSSLLNEEERYWHKSARKPRKDGAEIERVWANEFVFDPRIAVRMRKFELDPEEEERAKRIFAGSEKSRAIPAFDLRNEKPIIGNLDEDD